MLRTLKLNLMILRPVSYTHLDVYKRQGMIKVATSATAVDKFGDGVKSASLDESAKTLKIINESGEEISLNLSDVALWNTPPAPAAN